MHHGPQCDQINASAAEGCVLQIAAQWLSEECAHEQAGCDDDLNGTGDLQCSAPTRSPSWQVRAQHKVKQTRKQDVDVSGSEEHSGQVRHAAQMVVYLVHILAGEDEGEQSGDAED